jgi:quercetin dioxygenase-like cupin family protein
VPNSVRPYVLRDGEGERVQGPVGGPVVFKANAKTTNGTFTALENVVMPRLGPPQHIHVREDEMYYILDGRLRFKMDGEFSDAPAGSFVFIPRGTPHAFQNVGDGPARILVMFTPSGMERFFEGVGALSGGMPDPETFGAIYHDAWMQVVGPPLAESDPLP